MSQIKLQNKGDGHWCHYHTLWLGTFKDDPNVYVCWTRHMDEMGGNPIEVTLERVNADSRMPLRTLNVQEWHFRDGDPDIGVTGWERLGRFDESDWGSFIQMDSYQSLWDAIHERLSGKEMFNPIVLTIPADKALQYRQFMDRHDKECSIKGRYYAMFTPTCKYAFTARDTGLGTDYKLICDCGEKFYADAGDDAL